MEKWGEQTMKKMRIQRIERMESLFDEVQNKLEENGVTAEDMVQELKIYYENGLWLSDYEADERGELPMGLKRGVLSQDGLYDLLHKVDEQKKKKL